MKMTREERQRRDFEAEIENLKAKNAKLKTELEDEYELRTLIVESLKTRLERAERYQGEVQSALLGAMASIRNSR
jgi:FtsZ-binding cell division protein ZapB